MPTRTRLALAVVASVAVLALAGAVVLGGAGAQEADAEPNATITVGATGTTSAPPDLAVVDVAVEATADSPEAARSMVAENVSGMRAALAEANVSDDRIRTTRFAIRTDRDENGTVTYRAVHAFELRVPADDAGSVVDTAVDGGATRVDGVRFTLADETSRELRGAAIEAALENARADAEVIADATGLEVDAVTAVETTDGDVGPVFAEADRAAETEFEPGPVTVTVRVTVTYAAS